MARHDPDSYVNLIGHLPLKGASKIFSVYKKSVLITRVGVGSASRQSAAEGRVWGAGGLSVAAKSEGRRARQQSGLEMEI